jgi:L-lactate dehydrogenase complex protein LldG
VNDPSHVLEKVRRSLGRGGRGGAAAPAEPPPPPPELSDPIVRLVRPGSDLAELFAKRAGELKMIVTRLAGAEELPAAVADFLRDKPVKSVALSVSPLLEQTGLRGALEAAGLAVSTWDQLTLDGMYDFDCAVTTVDYAIAESGTLVIKPSANQGRSMSLTPMYHVAVVEASQLLPDMVDLFQTLAAAADRSNYILISGPSKTADIEMNVVTGVHGPNVVAAFVVG